MSAPVASDTRSPFRASREISACSAGRAESGGDQEGAELVAVQCGGVRLVVQPGPADVRRAGRRLTAHMGFYATL
jgi:hypothetical protein